jgi:hypothetical protein
VQINIRANQLLNGSNYAGFAEISLTRENIKKRLLSAPLICISVDLTLIYGADRVK